jgi:hypothetical protein
MVVNFSHEEIELPKATVLGVAEENSASILTTINDEGNLDSSPSVKTRQGVNTVVNDAFLSSICRTG